MYFSIHMITVAEAEQMILSHIKDYGIEEIPFPHSLGRVLAENLIADRDLPPFNRVAMDGIAIQFAAMEKEVRSFRIKATQAAGEMPIDIEREDECIEIMTGAALPETADCVIRYEDTEMKDGVAIVSKTAISRGQNIHFRGNDTRQNDIVARAPRVINSALIGIAASVGKTTLQVKKLPRAVIISTGNELVEVSEIPAPQQIRRSNNYTIQAVLQQHHVDADMLHIPDDAKTTHQAIRRCLEEYDVILLSGGVSMGKFDYVPQVLQELAVEKYFHKVQQRPGKPFWFGGHANGTRVFAFPGNPASAFMCLHRYFLPWLNASLGIPWEASQAVLKEEVTFNRPLHYFLQVSLATNNNGQVVATPVQGNGSGDFVNLLQADAFMELPAEKSTFNEGEMYKVWRCNL